MATQVTAGCVPYQPMIKPCVIGSAAAYVAVLVIAAVAMSILFPPISAVVISGVGLAGAAAIAGTGLTISLLVSYLSFSNFRSAKNKFDEIQKNKRPIEANFNVQCFSDVKACIEKIPALKNSVGQLSRDQLKEIYKKVMSVFEEQNTQLQLQNAARSAWGELAELKKQLAALKSAIETKFSISL